MCSGEEGGRGFSLSLRYVRGLGRCTKQAGSGDGRQLGRGVQPTRESDAYQKNFCASKVVQTGQALIPIFSLFDQNKKLHSF